MLLESLVLVVHLGFNTLNIPGYLNWSHSVFITVAHRTDLCKVVMFPAAGSKKNRKSEERQVNIFTALTVFYTVCVCVELKIQTYQQ